MKITEVITTPPNTPQEQWEAFNSATIKAIAFSTGMEIEDIPQEALDMVSEIYQSNKYPDIYDAAEKVAEYIKTL